MTGSRQFFSSNESGHSAARGSKLEEAAITGGIDEFPEHPQALTNLGLALYELQEYEESRVITNRLPVFLPVILFLEKIAHSRSAWATEQASPPCSAECISKIELSRRLLRTGMDAPLSRRI
jgi:hypothetical protein